MSVEEATPSAVTPLAGEGEIVEFATLGTPAIKATVEVTPVNPLGLVMLIVLLSATVDLIVPVISPALLVTAPIIG